MQKITLLKYCFVLLLSCLISGCGGGAGGHTMGGAHPDKSTGSPLNPNNNLRPAVPTSPYASILVDCALAATSQEIPLCPQTQLAPLGAGNKIPTKKELFDRLVVPDDKTASRFSDLLDKMPSDIYKLFRAVTVVVISEDISPSYFSGMTGGIYLDAREMENFSSEKVNTYFYPHFEQGDNKNLNFREIISIVDKKFDQDPDRSGLVKFGMLLFHELTHANDFMPPDQLGNLNSRLTMFEQFDAFTAAGVYNRRLVNVYPLTDPELTVVAESLYGAGKLNNAALALEAADVGERMSREGANDSYAYFTDYEDSAMLAEETMAKYYFDVDRVLAFADKPSYSQVTCNSFITRWGQLNRAGDAQVKKRAKLVLQHILGENNVDRYLNAMPSRTIMPNGSGFCLTIEGMVN